MQGSEISRIRQIDLINKTILFIITLTITSCVIYIPKEYFDKYTSIKSNTDGRVPGENGYYYSYFFDNKYCDYYFFFKNNLVATTSLPRAASNSRMTNHDSLLTSWLNSETFIKDVNWSYYDFKNDTVLLYNYDGPEPQNRFFSMADLVKATAIVKPDSLVFPGRIRWTQTFFYFFKSSKNIKLKSTSLTFQEFPTKPNPDKNEFELMYIDYLKGNYKHSYRWDKIRRENSK